MEKEDTTCCIHAEEAVVHPIYCCMPQEGADVNTICCVPPEGAGSDQALITAAGLGHLNCVQSLIKLGADVNVSHGNRSTALMKASENGHDKCITELINEGADVSKSGERSLILAAKRGPKNALRY